MKWESCPLTFYTFSLCRRGSGPDKEIQRPELPVHQHRTGYKKKKTFIRFIRWRHWGWIGEFLTPRGSSFRRASTRHKVGCRHVCSQLSLTEILGCSGIMDGGCLVFVRHQCSYVSEIQDGSRKTKQQQRNKRKTHSSWAKNKQTNKQI